MIKSFIVLISLCQMIAFGKDRAQQAQPRFPIAPAVHVDSTLGNNRGTCVLNGAMQVLRANDYIAHYFQTPELFKSLLSVKVMYGLCPETGEVIGSPSPKLYHWATVMINMFSADAQKKSTGELGRVFYFALRELEWPTHNWHARKAGYRDAVYTAYNPLVFVDDLVKLSRALYTINFGEEEGHRRFDEQFPFILCNEREWHRDKLNITRSNAHVIIMGLNANRWTSGGHLVHPRAQLADAAKELEAAGFAITGFTVDSHGFESHAYALVRLQITDKQYNWAIFDDYRFLLTNEVTPPLDMPYHMNTTAVLSYYETHERRTNAEPRDYSVGPRIVVARRVA